VAPCAAGTATHAHATPITKSRRNTAHILSRANNAFQIEIDGFVDAHDHAFQRALRDRAARCSAGVVLRRPAAE
jgi:hypothetical protein